MTSPTPPSPDDRRLLLAVAAPAEAAAVLRGLGADPALAQSPWRLHPVARGIDLVVTGISKSNAAGAVARTLDPARHRAAVSLGVAGALPGPPRGAGAGLPIGAVVVADACIFADEGLEAGEHGSAWTDCAALGFPLGPPPVQGSRIPVPTALVAELRGALGPAAGRGPEMVVGGVATVSTCSGADHLAQRVRERTGAVAEAMEGAAVALVGARLGVAAGEIRVISNTTGARATQTWDLRAALERLGSVAAALGSAAARGR